MKAKEYFILQIKLINRTLYDVGLSPILGYCLLLVAYSGFSLYLFYKSSFAAPIYSLTALYSVHLLGDERRNEFLKYVFSHSDYIKIRLMENLFISVPFILFLAFKGNILYCLLLLILSLLLAFVDRKSHINFTIPTPFFNRPFEFLVGFRKTFLLIAVAYFLMLMSIIYENFNLGIFSLLLIYLIALSYYSELEHEYLIWVNKLPPSVFLNQKLQDATYHSTILVLPLVVTLSLYYPSNVHLIFGTIILGLLYLVVMILVKYASFPNNISIVYGVILANCITMPFFLLCFIPFFYKKSIRKLHSIL